MAFANPSRSLFGTGDTINMLPVLIPSRLASSGTLLAISPRRIASAAMDELAPAFILAVVALSASAETLAILGFWLYPSIFAAIVLALVLAPNRWEEAASNLPILITCAAVHIVSVPSASCRTSIIASAPVMRVPRAPVSFTAGRVTPDHMGFFITFFFIGVTSTDGASAVAGSAAVAAFAGASVPDGASPKAAMPSGAWVGELALDLLDGGVLVG